MFSKKKILSTFEPSKFDSVAQLVEQLTLNQWVESSSLSGVTLIIKHIQEFPICAFFLGVNIGVNI